MSVAATSCPSPVRPSFEEVFREGWPHVCRVLRSRGVPERDCEDAAQDVFQVVLRRLGQYEDRDRLKAWLSTIAEYVARRHHWKLRTKSIVVDGEVDLASLPAPSLNADSSAIELVLLALEEVDEDRREPFLMHEAEAIPVPVIAETLGIPKRTIEWQLAKARQEFDAALARLERRMLRETGTATVTPIRRRRGLLAIMWAMPVPDGAAVWERLEHLDHGGGGCGPAAPAMPAAAALSGATVKAAPMVLLLLTAVVAVAVMVCIALAMLVRKPPAPVEARPDVVAAAPVAAVLAPSAAPVPSGAPPPSPAQAASSSTATAAAPVRAASGTAAAERALLTDADDAIRAHQFDKALAFVREHTRRWPDGGRFAMRREDTHFRALLGARRFIEAQALLDGFGRAHPGHSLVKAWQQQMDAAH